MKKLHRFWCLAICLVLVVSLLGCGSQEATQPSEDEMIDGKLVLVDPRANSGEPEPYLPEMPSADNEGALTGESSSRAESQPASSQRPSAANNQTQPQTQTSKQAETAELESKPQATELSKPTKNAQQSVQAASPPQEPALPQKPESVSLQVSEQALSQAQSQVSTYKPTAVTGEVRSVWISYLELNNLLKGKTKSQFTANIRAVFDNCRDYGLNTVIVHVRPFADAIYQSDYYPWSYICTGTEGVDPGFDPLQIMVEEAHARDLKIEAWVNPYRIRAADSKTVLCDTNQATKWLNANDSAVIKYNGVTSYNPASTKAQELIVNGMREIVRNYDVDGIHIDDYFYPTMDTAFDAPSYQAYKTGGGSLSLADWRRSNVEKLIKAMYAGVKAENPDVLFGISPQSSVYNNFNAMYLDVAKISASSGYCDYICPQIYFGYENGTQPYLTTVQAWDKMVNNAVVDLYVGVAVYKVGALDNWAGNGKNEWLNNTDLLKQMVESAREHESYKGFVLYRYDSMFNPDASVNAHVQKEYKNLKSIL